MPELDLGKPEYKSKYQPIVVKGLGDETYSITKIDDELAEQMQKMFRKFADSMQKDEPVKGSDINEFLGVIFKTDPEKFKDVDWRVKQDVITFIVEHLNLQARGEDEEGKVSVPVSEKSG